MKPASPKSSAHEVQIWQEIEIPISCMPKSRSRGKKNGFLWLRSAEKSSFWQEAPIPVGFQESGKGFALQKCRFLATRAPEGSSGYRNADFLPSAEARTLSRTACAAPKSATLPLLSLRFLMGRRKGKRPVPSPLASHRPERQHDGESAPSPRQRHRLRPRLRLAFTFLPAPHSQAGVPPACTRQFSAYDKMTIA